MRALSTILLLTLAATATAQTIDVSVAIDTRRERRPISPLIYGVNNSSNPSANLASRRQGGDRYTTYNWENNASNSGHWTDDPAWVSQNNTSDAYLTGNIPSGVPAKAITDFHDASIAEGIYSIVTLQAGFVARDLHGPVSEAEAIPNRNRWREVRFAKEAPFTAQPDTADEYVYIDELLDLLIDRYGPASSATGIKAYGISNEPGAWNGVHPRSHPVKEGYAEIFEITKSLASTIKRMDPTAEVFGGVTYGFGEMKDFQGAADRGMFPGYRWYIDALLGEMRSASSDAGMRLMDVLDVHWYSEAEGDEPYRSVAWSESTPDIVAARLQAPRSLWDRTYVEKSWITGSPGRYSHTSEVFGEQAIALIPRLRTSIESYNPGTKLAFGEFGFGGYDHVSGGIAVADALGIFGREGVYYANHWDEIAGYVESAYRLYRNYDGALSTYGDIAVAATASDDNSSVYASVSADGSELHIVMLNRSMSATTRSTVTIASDDSWSSGRAWGFDGSSPDVRAMGPAPVDAGMLTWELAPMSAVHIVLPRATASAADDEMPSSLSAVIAPNPCTTSATLMLELDRPQRVAVELYDALGRMVASFGDGVLDVGRSTITIATEDLAPGRYVARIVTADGTLAIPVTVLR
jgi:hypothetical protein